MAPTNQHPSDDQRPIRIAVVLATLLALALLLAVVKGCSQSIPVAPGNPSNPQPVASAGPR